MRVLLVEDEKRLSQAIEKGLVESGYAVDKAYDGEEGLYLAETESYDVIILDIMLPKLDGISICKELRKKNITTPILMLTAKTHVDDRVTGLDAGADDYLAKPFAFVELKSRIQALIRRSHQQADSLMRIADLEVDPLKHTVSRAGKTITLTPKEFSILEYLLRHTDEVVTRTQIIEHTWDYNFDSMSNVVDVFMTTLRKKIDGNRTHKLIHTVHIITFGLFYNQLHELYV
jgi:DNA-binding response OmpR family regulator